MKHLILALGAVLCLPVSASGLFDDVFTNSFETRRLATAKEYSVALRVGRSCAGFLIAPDIGMSAAHCERSGRSVTSGIALRAGRKSDGRILRTLEIGHYRSMDYWIFEIEWDEDTFPKGMKLVSSIQVDPDDLSVGDNDEADMLYTLGFPGDISRGKLFYSWGYGKTSGTNGRIKNNISLINGNSGGGIWRAADHRLVSIVSGGPHMLGQPGWEENDWNDPKHWNWGPAIWRVYEESRVLAYLFPDGESRYSRSLAWGLERAGLPLVAGF